MQTEIDRDVKQLVTEYEFIDPKRGYLQVEYRLFVDQDGNYSFKLFHQQELQEDPQFDVDFKEYMKRALDPAEQFRNWIVFNRVCDMLKRRGIIIEVAYHPDLVDKSEEFRDADSLKQRFEDVREVVIYDVFSVEYDDSLFGRRKTYKIRYKVVGKNY